MLITRLQNEQRRDVQEPVQELMRMFSTFVGELREDSSEFDDVDDFSGFHDSDGDSSRGGGGGGGHCSEVSGGGYRRGFDRSSSG